MSGLHTSTVESAHDYTKADTPWIIEETPSGRWRLFHYLSGGGMRCMGRTVSQELAKRRQQRFLAIAGVIVSLWMILYFV